MNFIWTKMFIWTQDVHINYIWTKIFIWTSYEKRCSFELKMFIWTKDVHMNYIWTKMFIWTKDLHTGCFRFIVKMCQLITQARKQPFSWDRWHFLPLIGTFWYLFAKKFHDYWKIIHLCSLWRGKTVEIRKIY